MGFLNSLFGKKAPERKPSDTPANPTRPFAMTRNSLVPFDANVVAAEALKHPVISRCLNKIAQSIQTVDWYAEQDDTLPVNERAGATAVKLMNSLLKSPNLNYGASQLRYWMAINFALYGRVPFKVGVGTEKLPNGIYPLAVKHVTYSTDNRGLLNGYVYGFGEQEERLPTRARSNGSAYAHEIFTPTIDGTLDNSCNLTPLRSLGLPATVISLLLIRAKDTASGHPNSKYIVTSEKLLTEPQQDAIRDFIEGSKPDQIESGNILTLHHADIKVHVLDNDLNNIHSKMPLDDMSRMCFGAFGIPVALMGLGAADGAKFAGNYEESRASFWEDTLIPGYCSPIADGLTAALCPPGMVIRFDYDSIPALAYSRVARAAKLQTVGFVSYQEKRELAGYPKEYAAGEVGDKPTAPVATTPTGANSNAGQNE